MLKKKALKKIFITTLSVFILLVAYMIPYQENTKEVGLEVEYTTGLYTNTIYLLNNNNHLVKSKILLDKKTTEDKVKQIIDTLTSKKTNFIPNGMNALLSKKVVLKDVVLYDDIVHLNFNEEFLNTDPSISEKVIEALVYSITDITDVNGICIKVDDKVLEEFNGIELPNVITRDFGLNKTYDIKDRNNINKVVVYYISKINNDTYYVPVTKYLNTNDDKIEIIIKDLASSYIYEDDLISVLNQNTKLLNYELNSDVAVLNFNKDILNEDNSIDEEVLYIIGFSIYDNYNIKSVMYKVDGKEITKKSIKELE